MQRVHYLHSYQIAVRARWVRERVRRRPSGGLRISAGSTTGESRTGSFRSNGHHGDTVTAAASGASTQPVKHADFGGRSRCGEHTVRRPDGASSGQGISASSGAVRGAEGDFEVSAGGRYRRGTERGNAQTREVCGRGAGGQPQSILGMVPRRGASTSVQARRSAGPSRVADAEGCRRRHRGRYEKARVTNTERCAHRGWRSTGCGGQRGTGGSPVRAISLRLAREAGRGSWGGGGGWRNRVSADSPPSAFSPPLPFEFKRYRDVILIPARRRRATSLYGGREKIQHEGRQAGFGALGSPDPPRVRRGGEGGAVASRLQDPER